MDSAFTRPIWWRIGSRAPDRMRDAGASVPRRTSTCRGLPHPPVLELQRLWEVLLQPAAVAPNGDAVRTFACDAPPVRRWTQRAPLEHEPTPFSRADLAAGVPLDRRCVCRLDRRKFRGRSGHDGCHRASAPPSVGRDDVGHRPDPRLRQCACSDLARYWTTHGFRVWPCYRHLALGSTGPVGQVRAPRRAPLQCQTIPRASRSVPVDSSSMARSGTRRGGSERRIRRWVS